MPFGLRNFQTSKAAVMGSREIKSLDQALKPQTRSFKLGT